MADKLELMKRSFAMIKYSMPPCHADAAVSLVEQMCEVSAIACLLHFSDAELRLLTHR